MRRAIFAAACGLCLLSAAPARANSFLQRRFADWVDDLTRSDKPARRSAAAFALGRMGADGAGALPALARKAADDQDARVRDLSAAAVGDVVSDMIEAAAERYWKDVGRHLLEALGDGDPRVRRSAAYAIGAFGKAAAPAADLLRAKLTKD